MDSAYLQLISSCNEAVQLATIIASNVNYDESNRVITDQFLSDCCKEARQLNKVLQEVIDRQYDNFVKSLPEK